MLVGVRVYSPRGWWGQETKIEAGDLKWVNIPYISRESVSYVANEEWKSIVADGGKLRKQNSV